MTISVGWCAGRPDDHYIPPDAGDREREVALRLLKAYPYTTAVRDFRGNSTPSPSWWTTQTCGAVSLLDDTYAIEPASVDVVLSWDRPQDTDGLAELLRTAPGWVRRTYLLGRHEPEKKVSPTQYHTEMAGIRTVIRDYDPSGRTVHLGSALILYRARIGSPDDAVRYLDPLVLSGQLDFLGWDAYPSNPLDRPDSSGVGDRYESATDFLDLPRSWAARTGLPYAIPELHHGRVADDPDGWSCADWHESVYREAAADGALFVTHFSYNRGDLVALNRMPEMTRWRSVIREAAVARKMFDAGRAAGRTDTVADLRKWLYMQPDS